MSARTLRRKVAGGTLHAARRFVGGRWRLLLSGAEVGRVLEQRSRSLAIRDFARLVPGFVLPRDEYGTEDSLGDRNLVVVSSFAPWGEEPPETGEIFDICVPLLDAPKVAQLAGVGRHEYEELRAWLRRLLDGNKRYVAAGRPESFRVRVVLDPAEVLRTLRVIVRKARPGRIQEVGGADPRRAMADLRREILAALFTKTLPLLTNARDPEAFLVASAKNFWRDRLRHELARRRGQERESRWTGPAEDLESATDLSEE